MDTHSIRLDAHFRIRNIKEKIKSLSIADFLFKMTLQFLCEN